MTTGTAATIQSSTFSPAERRALRALRTRYRQDADLFTNKERAQLLFLRWLYQTGHFAEADRPARPENEPTPQQHNKEVQ